MVPQQIPLGRSIRYGYGTQTPREIISPVAVEILASGQMEINKRTRGGPALLEPSSDVSCM